MRSVVKHLTRVLESFILMENLDLERGESMRR